MTELQQAQNNLTDRIKAQEFMKAVNAIIKKSKSIPATEEALKAFSNQLDDQAIKNLLFPRYSYEKQGFKGWELSNMPT